MFGSNVLEVIIGLMFVYSLLSLLCSTINEQIIVRLLALRARTLEDGIKTMLKTIPHDPKAQNLTQKFYEHPLIQSLAMGIKKPSYISTRAFTLVLKDVLKDANIDMKTIPALKPMLNQIKTDAQQEPANKDSIDLKTVAALKPVQDQIKTDAQQEQASIENWYDDAMDRVSGWYKRKTQVIIFLLGLLMTVSLNVDTINIITDLTNSSALRATIVSAAQGSSANTQTSASLTTLQQRIEQIEPVIGWSPKNLPADVWAWLLKIPGLLATTFAISLGAPFWFDLLNKFITLRSSGPPPPKDSRTTSSTDTTLQPVAETNITVQ
jgi:hypothetical protein